MDALLEDRLLTASLRQHPLGAAIVRILAAALQAADPERAVRRVLRRHGDLLEVAGQVYDLKSIGRLYLVGIGKAGWPMARAAAEILSDRLSGGIVIVKEGYAPVGEEASWAAAFTSLQVVEAGHPIPDERSVQGARRVVALLESAGPSDLVLCLISGGGSALLTAPPGGISLDALQRLTEVLLACGASIREINTLRKHLDLLKGGRLARLASPARVVALILSDVVGDALDSIASGPTVADITSFADALSILRRYQIERCVPRSILDYLRCGARGQVVDNPRPDNPLFAGVQNVLIGSNRLSLEAALRQAEREGCRGHLLTDRLQGEATQAGRMAGALARQLVWHQERERAIQPACWVAGGETTVTLGDAPGLGGRNQELALAAALEMDGLPGAILATLATDGGDGPTDAAGAVVTGETIRRAARIGLDGRDFLARHDAYPFFAALGDLLKPGPTRTNVNDLLFLFVPVF